MPQYVITYGSQEHQAEVRRLNSHVYEVTVDGASYTVDACPAEPSVFSLLVDGSHHEVHYARDRDRFTLLIAGEHFELEARNRRVRSAFRTGVGLLSGRQTINAPMPGRVVRLLVEKGQEVGEGASLLTLEAMKMENQLRSPVGGTVLEIGVTEGQVVSTGEKLMVVG